MSYSRKYFKVYINGHYRKDIKVLEIELTSGLTTPSKAFFLIETENLIKNTLIKGDSVFVKCNSEYIFCGIITNKNTTRSKTGSYVSWEARGIEYIFETIPCHRNYNENPENTGFEEYVSCKYIIWDLINAINSASTIQTIFIDGGISEEFAGTRMYRGMNMAEAIEKTIAYGSNGERAKIKKKYISATRIQVSVFYGSYGNKKQLTYATDPTKDYSNQPGGYPNISEIVENLEVGTFANRVLLEGDNRRFQHSVTLQSAWKGTGNSLHWNEYLQQYLNDEDYEKEILKNRAFYTKRDYSGIQNIYYDFEAERVGTLYVIPYLDLFFYLRYDSSGNVIGGHKPQIAEIDEKLIQDDVGLTYPEKSIINSFILVFWNDDDEATYEVVTKGYSIKDNRYVIFSEPLCKREWDDVAIEYKTIFPHHIKLTATFIDKIRITYDSGKTGKESYTKTEYINDNSFRWENIYKSYVLLPDKKIKYVENANKRYDIAAMQKYADMILNQKKGKPKFYQITQDYINLDIEIGDSVTSNVYRLNNMYVSGIIYRYWSGDSSLEGGYTTHLRLGGVD